MAFRLGDIATGAQSVRRECWPKETHSSQGKAEAHLRALARRDGRDGAELNTYACRWCGGWHVGHQPMQKEDAMPTRLVNLFVKSIALVKKPANKRTFLVVKSEGSRPMRAKTFDECLKEWQESGHQQAPALALSKADLDRVEALMKDTLQVAGTKIEKATKTAVDELEELVAQRIQANPALTRQAVVGEIFQADPGLYEKARAETTVDGHGRTLRAIYDRVEVVGKSDAAGSVEAEVERRLDGILAKESRLTREQAMQFAFRQDPALYERWRAAYA